MHVGIPNVLLPSHSRSRRRSRPVECVYWCLQDAALSGEGTLGLGGLVAALSPILADACTIRPGELLYFL